MSMVSIHAAALESGIPGYHEFLGRFSKTKKIVYGFVEGKEDFGYYRGFIEHIIPDEWEVELWSAGSRDRVVQIHKHIDWRRFSKKRVCFFIDRDLSDLIPDKLPDDTNIYVTDKYSIENSIVTRGTCRRILTEVCGFSDVSHKEMDLVCNQFEAELESFLVAMISTMARMLSWRRRQEKANLNNINIGKMFSVKNGTVSVNKPFKTELSRMKYIHGSAGISFDPELDISSINTEFSKVSIYQKFVRGKYVLWFLVEFCKSVHQNSASFFPTFARQPRMTASISTKNAVTIIGNRARIPQSLRIFHHRHFLCVYQ